MSRQTPRALPPSTPLPPYARLVAGGIDLHLKIVPGASRSAIAGPLGDRLKVRIAAPPEHGQANRAVLALLDRHFGLRTELVAGGKSAEKTVRLIGATGWEARWDPV
jgi:uncharacterized protein (TIGR00251 family)